jgi:hypothetical protein
MNKFILPLVLLTSLFAPAASAYKIYGSGNLSCGIWLDSRETKDTIHRELQSWVTGFVSGSVFMGPTVKATDIQSMFSWIDNYCQNSRFDSVGQAAAALMYELARETQ